MKKMIAVLATAAIATLSIGSYAADATTDTTTAPAITKDQASKLKTQSTAEYKAKGKVAEANEDLNKGDCKNNLDGSAKRACDKSATAQARSEKADAKLQHESEKKAINDAAKPATN